MVKKNYRKLVSIVSATLLVLTIMISTPTVNAETLQESQTIIDSKLQSIIEEDKALEENKDELVAELSLLNDIGLSIEDLKSIRTDESNITYLYEYLDEVDDEITVKALNDGFLLNIVEGFIKNKVVIKNDGRIFIDGVEVECNSEENIIVDDDEVLPMAGNVMNWLTTTCPYGKKADYTYKLGTGKNSDITLTDSIENLAISVVVIIICKYIGVSSKASTGIGTIVSWIRSRNPSTRGLSYKVTNYAHKNYHNKYITPIRKYAYRCDYKWYSEKNYGGAEYKKTYYNIKEIG